MTVPAIGLTITTAGLTRFTQAQEGQPLDLTISEVAFASQPFVVAPTLTAMPGEVKRIATIAGDVQDDSIVHLVIRDDTTDTYLVYGIGLYLDDGTLFAVYGQQTAMLEKSMQTALITALDLKFPAIDVSAINFGDSSFVNPPATEDTKGIAAIASQAAVNTGTDDQTIVTPLKLATRLTNWIAALWASSAETIVGVIANKGVTPAGLLAALDNRLGAGEPSAYAKTLIAATTATLARSVLGLGNVATLNTGSGNGIDADKLDGLEGADYLRVTASSLVENNGYRVFSDDTIECWGHVEVAGDSTVTVDLPTPHTTFVVPVGSCARASADEASIGVVGPVGSPPTGFQIRNNDGEAVTFYWQTKGK